MGINSISPITSFRAAGNSAKINKSEEINPKYYGSADSAEFSKPKEKHGFFNRLKEGFINFRKFFINLGYITAGTVKGAAYGGVAGAATLGALAVKNSVKKAPQVLTTGNKVVAAAVGLGVLGIELVKAKLKANDRGADLDHKWHTGHDRN